MKKLLPMLGRFQRNFTWFMTSMFVPVLVLCCSMTTIGQISGKVSAADDNSPLPGVSVRVKGSEKGSSTSADGGYKINAKPSDVLVFSFIGYASQEIAVGNKTTINVSLAQESKMLQEVVTTALGISKDKRTLTNSIQSVQGVELIKAREPNAINSLSGKVAGLTVGASQKFWVVQT
jgi:hypothetical protein